MYSTNPNGLDIVIGEPVYGGTDFGIFIFAGGIFDMNCWESHEQVDVGSPTQSCLIIITLTVLYQQKILLVVVLFIEQIKVVCSTKKTQSILILQKIEIPI